MTNSKHFARHVAAAAILFVFFEASAFAESRHLSGTRNRSQSVSKRSVSRPSIGRSTPRSVPRIQSRSVPRRSVGSRSAGSRSVPRVDRSYRGSRGPSTRRSNPSFGGRSYYNDGRRFHGRGRIDRVVRYHSGYRVWLGGWGYPFYVPYRYYDPFRYRVGVFIGFNAFYDPLGYYSVYDGQGYGYSRDYREERDERISHLRGTVVSVDLRTGLVVLDQEGRSRRTITALLPPRDRRVDDIRPGDFVEFSGDWVRERRYDFDADRMERIEPDRQDPRDR